MIGSTFASQVGRLVFRSNKQTRQLRLADQDCRRRLATTTAAVMARSPTAPHVDRESDRRSRPCNRTADRNCAAAADHPSCAAAAGSAEHTGTAASVEKQQPASPPCVPPPAPAGAPLHRVGRAALTGQDELGIGRCDLGVAPRRDLALEDLGQRARRQRQVLLDAGHVGEDGDGTDEEGDVQHVAACELQAIPAVGGHGDVATAKVGDRVQGVGAWGFGCRAPSG